MFSHLDIPHLLRLQSLCKWPETNVVTVSQIANAGFSFSPEDEAVKCRSCNLKVNEWNTLKKPLFEHMRLNPHCPFMIDQNGEIFEEKGTPDEDDIPAKMKFKYHRLQSFQNWSNHYVVCPFELADAGLFFSQTERLIQCAFCEVVFENRWCVDNPLTMHRKKSPECLFVIQKLTFPVAYLRQSDRPLFIRNTMYTKPKSPSMVTKRKRLASFGHWPLKNPTPDALACCGFYYTGSEDKVECFHCRVLLGDWKEGDDPWVRHAQDSAVCYFLNETQSKRPPSEVRPVDELVEGVAQTLQVSTSPSEQDPKKPPEWAACKICADRTIDMVLEPCRHFVMCNVCAKQVPDCPVCREPILGKTKAYVC